jgi:hypothetical protein
MNNYKKLKEDAKSNKKNFFLIAFEIISCQLFIFYRRMTKIILHYFTGKSELERICANETIESIRILKIGN